MGEAEWKNNNNDLINTQANITAFSEVDYSFTFPPKIEDIFLISHHFPPSMVTYQFPPIRQLSSI